MSKWSQDAQKGCPARPQRVKTGGGTHRTSWGCSPIQWILANGKTPPALPPSENLNRYVEDLNDARTTLADFFSILLEVWTNFMDLAAHITSHMRRPAVSVPSNLRDGAARRSRNEFGPFLHIASGSIARLDMQLLLAIPTGFVSGDHIIPHIEEVRKFPLGLLRSLEEKPITHHSSSITPPL